MAVCHSPFCIYGNQLSINQRIVYSTYAGKPFLSERDLSPSNERSAEQPPEGTPWSTAWPTGFSLIRELDF
jgi:hypothetical protein